jgi:hypothetical protein
MVSWRDARHPGTDLLDDTTALVSEDHGVREAVDAVAGTDVGVADADTLDLDENLVRSGSLEIHGLEVEGGLGALGDCCSDLHDGISCFWVSGARQARFGSR